MQTDTACQLYKCYSHIQCIHLLGINCSCFKCHYLKVQYKSHRLDVCITVHNFAQVIISALTTGQGVNDCPSRMNLGDLGHGNLKKTYQDHNTS